MLVIFKFSSSECVEKFLQTWYTCYLRSRKKHSEGKTFLTPFSCAWPNIMNQVSELFMIEKFSFTQQQYKNLKTYFRMTLYKFLWITNF